MSVETRINILARPPLGANAAPNTVLLVLITAIGTLGMHSFTPALPMAAAELGVSAGTMQLTITVYLVGLAVGQLFYGATSDRFGRRPVLLAALVIFVVGMALAVVAPNAPILIAARALQALGACGGVALGRAMVRDGTNAEGAAGKLALLMLAMSVVPAASPTLGGFINAGFGWRAIFVFLTASGLALFAASLIALPETSRHRLAMPGLVPMLKSYGRLLRHRSFCGYMIAGACNSTSIYAFIAASPFLFFNVLHRPPQEFGFYYLFMIGGMSIGAFLASRIAGRLPLRRTIALGSSIALIGGALLLGADLLHLLSVATILVPICIFSVGCGLASPSTLSGAMSSVPNAIGAAASLYGFWQFTWGALCTMIVGVWHADSALPSAVILFGSTAIGLLAMAATRPPAAD
jgi:DHA1 family bicyclomycin/chloramphenicol resistance-like MFS transporter